MIAFNHFAPHGEKDLKLIDFMDNTNLDRVIEYARANYSTKKTDGSVIPCEVYLVGFSLGGNFILKYMGSSQKAVIEGQKATQHEHVSAIASISNPFDLTHTVVKLKTTRRGIYDKILSRSLKAPFVNEAFYGVAETKPGQYCKKLPNCVLDFDNETRVKIWGFKSLQELYRKMSCGLYIQHINRPFLIIHAKDDEIVLKE